MAGCVTAVRMHFCTPCGDTGVLLQLHLFLHCTGPLGSWAGSGKERDATALVRRDFWTQTLTTGKEGQVGIFTQETNAQEPPHCSVRNSLFFL